MTGSGGEPDRDAATPAISVIMSVYNGAPYLEQAVRSILDQTMRDFDLIIVDDASTDHSPDIISRLATTDARLRPVMLENNVGPATARNAALDLAEASLIAVMDADDIALPYRLKRQKAVMDANPNCMLLGASFDRVDGAGSRIRTDIFNYDSVLGGFICKCRMPLSHPTIVFRRTFPDGTPVQYDSEFAPSEDYELVTRMADVGDVLSMPDVLLRYRIHDNSLTSTKTSVMKNRARHAAERAQQRALPPAIVQALQPVMDAYYDRKFDPRRFIKGFEAYVDYTITTSPDARTRLTRFAALELFHTLSTTKKSRLRGLATFLALKPLWIPHVFLGKIMTIAAKRSARREQVTY